MPDPVKKLTVYLCPECGEQITQSDYDTARGRIWGHYHDPPDDWEGPEDPWFDAVETPVAPLSALSSDEAVEEAARGLNPDVFDPQSTPARLLPPALVAAAQLRARNDARACLAALQRKLGEAETNQR